MTESPPEHDVNLRAPLDHPSYAGHFPGQPVAPGVLLLDWIVEAVGRGAPSRLDAVKFHRAVLPGESFTLRYTVSESRVVFRCVRGEMTLVEGRVTLGAGT